MGYRRSVKNKPDNSDNKYLKIGICIIIFHAPSFLYIYDCEQLHIRISNIIYGCEANITKVALTNFAAGLIS
jgi:hypothetical protein